MASELFPPANPLYDKGTTYTDTGPAPRIVKNPPKIWRGEAATNSESNQPRIWRGEASVRGVGGVASKDVLLLGTGAFDEPTDRINLQQNPERDPNEVRQYVFPKFGTPRPDVSKADPARRILLTEQSQAAAIEMYEKCRDDNVRKIIERFAGPDVTTEEVQTVLRENDELRVELGFYFKERLEKIPGMLGHKDSQLSRNVMKNGVPGYGDMLSREYAVVLALSMLDGTFKLEDVSKAEYTAIAKNGMYEDGEHRSAALRLLYSGS